MNELTLNDKMTSMQISEVTGKQHGHIMRDIKDEIEKLETSGVYTKSKFGLSERQDSTGRKIPYYILTKEGVLQLAARYDAVVRAKLIELAMKQEDKPVHIDSKFLFNIAAQLEEKEKRNLQLTAKIEQDKPKVLFASAVETARTSILIGDLAKVIKQNGLDIGQKRLFEWLRNNGYLIKIGDSRNMPTQRAMEQELFEVKESTVSNPDGSVRITKTTKVTGKGQVYFVNKFLNKTA